MEELEELEELKKGWNQLTEQLRQNARMNGQVLKKLCDSKVSSAWNKLIGAEIVCALVALIFIPILLLNRVPFDARCQGVLAAEYISAFMAAGVIWQIIKISILFRMDVAGSDILSIQKKVISYRRLIYREIYISFFLMVFLALWLGYLREIRAVWFYAYVGAVLLLGVGLMLWIYWGIYMRNLKIIQKNLEELREFEQDGQ